MNSHVSQFRRWSRKSGQALPLFVFFVVVLILFVGLGIDLGFAYITKANLSKAVDAASLEGMLAASQGTVTATAIAKSVFAANYGRPGRDTGTVTPNVSITYDALGHRLVSVSANTTINTFFIRILPVWKTLSVAANAQSQSRRLIMSLVLDRSGSMKTDGGDITMPPAVTNFISYFDDVNDYVSMNSFSAWATTDVPIGHNFKAPITSATLALDFKGLTVSEQGLTNGLVQNESVAISPGDDVVKVVVFFTDGLANGFQVTLNCGKKNISNSNGGNPDVWNPTTGADDSGSCSVPNQIPSIAGGNINTHNCDDMHDEAERRAIAISKLGRSKGNIFYCIGLGSGKSECGRPPINPDFLYAVANDPNNPSTFDSSQADTAGLAFVANDPTDVQDLFEKIRSDILLRLTQ